VKLSKIVIIKIFMDSIKAVVLAFDPLGLGGFLAENVAQLDKSVTSR